MVTYFWFRCVILCHVFLLICVHGVQAQNHDADTKSVEINNMSDVMLQLTTHQDRISKEEMKEHRSEEQRQSVKDETGNDIIQTNKRVSRKKPQDGNYEKVQLIDLTQRKVNRLRRRLTTKQAKGKTVYVKKEVVTKINRLSQEGLANVNVADTGIVSLAVDENRLKDEGVAVKNEGDTTDNTLATFAVGSQNTSANHLYRITRDGNYQYKDGKDIVGSAKFKEWFKNGYKPITETTFYYEIAEQPHIDLKEKNVSSFTSMSIEEQVKLIEENIKKSSDYIELDELTRSKTSVLGIDEPN